MTPADERIVQLLASWQASLDQHLQYTGLPDAEYWKLQAWPAHERPNRWIVELAMQRLAALKRIVQTRLAAGDPSLSEALELMAFLSNLVGAEHLERRIPQAEPDPDAAGTTPAAQKAAPTTRKRSRTGAARGAVPDKAAPRAKPTADENVVTDAVRLLSWGKAWHELPEAIERMADRPNATEVRKILKLARADIEQQVADELGGK